ncbi:MAG: chloride channel protein [Ktedonobacterales bacterium]
MGIPSVGLLASFRRYNRAYFQRWLLIGTLIGVVAGVGAIIFASLIAWCSHVLLTGIAGFTPPAPAGEGNVGSTSTGIIAHRWLIPVVTTLGGLLTGLIVFTLAPEAEGHGTDAAIQSFHEKGGRIRSRIPLIKMVASAITIGSGGSAGREGPTAQISAGFGSLLGDVLHLDDHDRRIAVAAGIGSGIGAIFKAPFGGALLSAEILYKRDFEADALFPSFVASAIGFTIYGAWAGWTPVFGPGAHFQFTHPASLAGYLILGVCAGLIGLLYPKTLYGVRDLFHKVPVPNHIKPAIGGLLVGLIGMALPQALGMGYGYVQFGINNDYVHLAAWLMFALVFVKILATSLTIGSGGSGGVFGPGMVIGGLLGGALWAGLDAVAPGLVAGTNVGAFVVVGMGAFFGGIAKAPLAVILMVAEMTGEYSLIAPAMLATMVAYLVTGDTSIYENQVPTRLDSPAHKNDYALPLLQSMTVRDAMAEGVDGTVATATPDTPLDDLMRLIRERHVASIPIVDQGRLVGLVTAADVARIPPQDVAEAQARQAMSRAVISVTPDESLYRAWLRMSRSALRQLAVVDPADRTRLVGMVTADMIGELLRPMGSAASLPPSQDASNALSEDGDEDESDNAAGQDHAEAVKTTRAAVGDPLAQVRVEDVMLATPRLLQESVPVETARQMLDERGAALMVVDADGRLTGIVTRSDLHNRKAAGKGALLTVGEVAVRNVVTARPDETVQVAVRRMSRLGLRQLPVVQGPLPARPLGLLRRSDVFAAYERAMGATAERSDARAVAD